MVADRKCSSSAAFLKENPAPYKFSAEDYYVYSQEESVNIFLQKSQLKKGPQETHSDLIEQAVSECFATTGESRTQEDVGATMTTRASNTGGTVSMQELTSFLSKSLQDNLLQSLLTLKHTPTAATQPSILDTSNSQTPCRDENDFNDIAIQPVKASEVGPSDRFTITAPWPASSFHVTPEPAVSRPEPAQLPSRPALPVPKPNVPAQQLTLPATNCSWESLAPAPTTLQPNQLSLTDNIAMTPTDQVLDLSIKPPAASNRSLAAQP
ncbi:MAG: hypothetical protein AB2693_01160, partial [Candidatus Thiodiazotropha sp.]